MLIPWMQRDVKLIERQRQACAYGLDVGFLARPTAEEGEYFSDGSERGKLSLLVLGEESMSQG